MNCHQVNAILDDFVDGAVSNDQRAQVARHLESCDECRASEARLRALLAKLRALPREVEPPRDPWLGITRRIMAEKVVEADFAARARRRYLLGAAAVAAAAVIVGIGVVTAVLVRNERATRVAGSVQHPATSAVMPASLGLAQAQATYAAARGQLLAALEARKGTLSPQTLAVVERNVRIIDRAVAEMQAALARDPANREIPELLVAAYQQEIDLLQRVTSLPGRG
jgi:predicted anti-sigma-YlaC factor YlaD